MTKTMLWQEWNSGLGECIEAEAQAQAICMQTKDFERAYHAFAAKQQAGVRRQLRHAPHRRRHAARVAVLRRRPPSLPGRVRALGGAGAAALLHGADETDLDAVHACVRGWCDRWAVPACCAPACRPPTVACARRWTCAAWRWRARRWPRLGPGRLRAGDAGPGQRAGEPVRQPAQQQRAAARRGQRPLIAAFALSEPDAGSDVAAMSATARRDGDGWVLDGTKTWISNAGLADRYVVFARSGEAPGRERHFGLHGRRRHAGAGRQRTHPGDRAAPAGHAAPDGLPRRRDRAARRAPGQGFAIAMGTLDLFRTTVGAAAWALPGVLWTRPRNGRSGDACSASTLADFQLTQVQVGDMARRSTPRLDGLPQRLDARRHGPARHARGLDGQALRHRGRRSR
jgi:alkylation response protein AidB-like acyl-CoA dehydrogenase